tara:strand:- start:1321 stop:1944 length:624 start_codon:yes stop_codon:yes gene_type:complete
MKNKNVKIITPSGIAQYPWLTTADTKFSETGEFKTNLILSKKDALSVSQIIDKAYSDSITFAKEKAKGKKIKEADKPYFDEVTEDGKPTGNVIFKFKCKAKVTTKNGDTFDNKPAIFDSEGKPMKNVNVWGGSQIKVSAELIPYYTQMVGAGISMRLRAAQVIELVEGGSNSEGYGFKKEQGYVHAESKSEELKNETTKEVSTEDDF